MGQRPIQTAIKLLPEIFRSNRPFFAKVQSIFHLCNYLAHPLMLLVALLALPSLHFLGGEIHRVWLIIFAIPLVAASLGPSILYTISLRYFYPTDWRSRIILLPALVLVGFGICISNTRAVLEAILGIKSGFIRTPKRGSTIAKSYNPVANIIPVLEIAAALYCTISLAFYLRSGNPASPLS